MHVHGSYRTVINITAMERYHTLFPPCACTYLTFSIGSHAEKVDFLANTVLLLRINVYFFMNA
jgi:hypothetical protein